MRLLDTILLAISALRMNFLRSILTTLGIIIGVASVILMVAVAEGARSEVEKRISSLGSNLLQLRPGSNRIRGRSVGADSRLPFSEGDVSDIRKKVPSVTAISGHFRRNGTIVYRNTDWLTNIDGVHSEYLQVRDWAVEIGRFFGEREYQAGAKVAVIGTTVARELFDDENSIGISMRIGDTPFEIIGVLEHKGATPSGRDQDDVILVPLSTLRSRLVKRHKLVPDQVGYVSVKIDETEDLSEAKEDIEFILRKRRGIKNSKSDNFYVRDVSAYQFAKTETQQTFSFLLAATAIISLIVGGIGIMNIMLVSVTERTREIGLRMAVGARRSDIRTQFLVEAVVLCLIGGIIGTVLGIGGAMAIALGANWPVLISPEVLALALAAAALTGISFGFFPAQRAARLNPIEALRSE
ncbi:macrolide export ATP-binding/permease protein MacB [bacterium MnTg02]|nr:macrolide export ATP-binding/permease protein MacB [bacterium MnTg02]